LGEFFVQFSQKGIEALKASMTAVQAQLAEMQKGADTVGRAISTSFTAALAPLAGFVTAGLAASSMGQVLGFHLQQLSLALAGLFGPELRKVTDLVVRVTDAIRNLSDEKRELIVRLTAAAIAAIAVAKVMPMVFAGLALAAGGVKALTAAFLGLDVASGGILPLIGALVTGLTALAVGTEAGRQGFSGMLDMVKPLLEMLTRVGKEVLTTLKPAFMGVATAIMEIAKVAVPLLAPLVAQVAMLGAELAKLYLESIMPGLALIKAMTPYLIQLATVLLRVVGGAVMVLIQLGRQLIAVFTDFLKLLGIAVPAAGRLARTATDRDRGPLSPRLGGAESVDAIYMRVAQATILATAGRASHEDRMEDLTRQVADNTSATQAAVLRLRPAIA
jgi:hypothetical protein